MTSLPENQPILITFGKRLLLFNFENQKSTKRLTNIDTLLISFLVFNLIRVVSLAIAQDETHSFYLGDLFPFYSQPALFWYMCGICHLTASLLTIYINVQSQSSDVKRTILDKYLSLVELSIQDSNKIEGIDNDEVHAINKRVKLCTFLCKSGIYSIIVMAILTDSIVSYINYGPSSYFIYTLVWSINFGMWSSLSTAVLSASYCYLHIACYVQFIKVRSYRIELEGAAAEEHSNFDRIFAGFDKLCSEMKVYDKYLKWQFFYTVLLFVPLICFCLYQALASNAILFIKLIMTNVAIQFSILASIVVVSGASVDRQVSTLFDLNQITRVYQ